MSLKLDLGDFVEDIGLPFLVLSVGVLALAPVLGPALGKAGKPLAKGLIKRGILVYEKGKEVFAEAKESFADLVAEGQAELAQVTEPKILQPSSEGEYH